MRVLLTQWMKGNDRAVVVLGDLNDGVQSNTLGIITQQPRFRLSPSSRVGSSSDVGLYSTALLQRLHSFQDVFYSHDYEGALEVLDHVLVSEQFYDHSRHRVWALDESRMWNDHVGGGDARTHWGQKRGLALARTWPWPAHSGRTAERGRAARDPVQARNVRFAAARRDRRIARLEHPRHPLGRDVSAHVDGTHCTRASLTPKSSAPFSALRGCLPTELTRL